MESQLIRRPVAVCCNLLASNSRVLVPSITASTTTPAITGTRQKSSARRLRRALNIAPHPSFLNDNTTSDRIIFNPPSSEASVYHTPFKFLPKSDPRRRANLHCLFNSQPGVAGSPARPFDASKLPITHPWHWETKPHHLTPADVEEIRRLRAEDPVKNTVWKLAAKYKCSSLFIMMCVQASRDHKAKLKEQEDALKERWGPIRTAARAERKRRLDMLFRGAL